MHEQTKMLPNILFILTDDQGAWAMGCAGNEEILTPNIDRLAAEGIRFTNFFCASPVCSPARASILTGMIPSQHGVHDWIKGGNIEKDSYRTKQDCLEGSCPGPFSVSASAVQIASSIVMRLMGIKSLIRLSLQITSFFKPSTRGKTMPAGTGVIRLIQ